MGDKFHRTPEGADVSLVDGPVLIYVEVCNLSGVVGRLDLDPKTPREMLIPAKTCRAVGPVSKLGAAGGGSDKRTEWYGVAFHPSISNPAGANSVSAKAACRITARGSGGGLGCFKKAPLLIAAGPFLRTNRFARV